jgi:death on curing protein
MCNYLVYFDVKHAVEVHDWIIENSGGLNGIGNIGLLESAIYHIRNDDYYPGIHQKLTHLVFSINKFHSFLDGNKRASIALGAYFLEVNGYECIVKKFVLSMENIAVSVAEGKIQKELLQEIIESLMCEDDYSENLKLKIFRAVS